MSRELSSSPPPSFAVDEFRRFVSDQPHIAIAVAAMQALTAVVRESHAQTMMGLEKELSEAIQSLKACNPASISLAAGCELFSRHVTRTALDTQEFSSCVARLVERGQFLANLSANSRHAIASSIDQFITAGSRILVHGYSRVVISALKAAHAKGKHFSLVVTEGRPDCDGYRVIDELSALGIPCTLIVDAAVAYAMERIDIVMVGAEGVAESGGIINKIGTYTLCVMAKAFKRPVYVCAECYKFARLFPLHQRDLPESQSQQLLFMPATTETRPDSPLASPSTLASPSNLDRRPVIHPFFDQKSSLVKIDNPSCDYTPPMYITLLFTDLGILTPSAVSDELIKLYY